MAREARTIWGRLAIRISLRLPGAVPSWLAVPTLTLLRSRRTADRWEFCGTFRRILASLGSAALCRLRYDSSRTPMFGIVRPHAHTKCYSRSQLTTPEKVVPAASVTRRVGRQIRALTEINSYGKLAFVHGWRRKCLLARRRPFRHRHPHVLCWLRVQGRRLHQRRALGWYIRTRRGRRHPRKAALNRHGAIVRVERRCARRAHSGRGKRVKVTGLLHPRLLQPIVRLTISQHWRWRRQQWVLLLPLRGRLCCWLLRDDGPTCGERRDSVGLLWRRILDGFSTTAHGRVRCRRRRRTGRERCRCRRARPAPC